MLNHSYNLDLYNSTLKSEVIKLSIIAIFLFLLFVGMFLYSFVQIKNERTKKIPYIQLLAVIVIFSFLSVSLGSQICSFTKDILDETYLQYEGSANIRTEQKVVFGGIPTGYSEHLISFEHNGEHIELSTRKDYGIDGDIEKIYIVYSQHSRFILEFKA